MNYDKHISLVYSKRWGISKYKNFLKTNYDIIHAYGASAYDNDDNEETDPIFSRKVIITGNNIGTPNRFGRLKIWE